MAPVQLALLLCILLTAKGDVFPLIELIHRLKTHHKIHSGHFGRRTGQENELTRRASLMSEMGRWVDNMRTHIDGHHEPGTLVPSHHLPHHLHQLWHQFHKDAWREEKMVLKEIAKIEDYIRRGVTPEVKEKLEGILDSLKKKLQSGH